MKKTFNYNIDIRISAWKRYKFEIDADDRNQADDIIKEIVRDNYPIAALENSDYCVSKEILPHSEIIEPIVTNDGEPTIQVLYEDLNDIQLEYIYDNKNDTI